MGEIRRSSSLKLKERVLRPVVEPDVILSLNDAQGEPAAIGSELGIEPLRERGAHQGCLALAIHPVGRTAGGLPWHVQQRTGGGHIKLRASRDQIRPHAVERDDGRTGHFQPAEIERHRKERPVLEVHQTPLRMTSAPGRNPPVASETDPRTVAAPAGTASRRPPSSTLAIPLRVTITTDSFY